MRVCVRFIFLIFITVYSPADYLSIGMTFATAD